MIAVAWIFRRSTPHRVDSLFRRLQLVSAGVYSLGHGGNDAQKTMGIIVMLLDRRRHTALDRTPNPPHRWTNCLQLSSATTHNVAWWIILTCHAAIALGTMFGGWRIVKTMGSGITRLQPVGGFCAETAAATTIIGATFGGMPISTTHAITGSILGVGTTKRRPLRPLDLGPAHRHRLGPDHPLLRLHGDLAYFLVHKSWSRGSGSRATASDLF